MSRRRHAENNNNNPFYIYWSSIHSLSSSSTHVQQLHTHPPPKANCTPLLLEYNTFTSSTSILKHSSFQPPTIRGITGNLRSAPPIDSGHAPSNYMSTRLHVIHKDNNPLHNIERNKNKNEKWEIWIMKVVHRRVWWWLHQVFSGRKLHRQMATIKNTINFVQTEINGQGISTGKPLHREIRGTFVQHSLPPSWSSPLDTIPGGPN